MNTAYALIPISILVLFFYTISFLISRLEIITKTTHRKIWNVLLLITFFITALLGLFLAIKVNYKLEIPAFDNYLKWHVDFGIGMAFIAIFHIVWHLNYYLKILKSSKSLTKSILRINEPVNSIYIKIFAFLLGMITIVSQVVIIREFLVVFFGNELVIGVILTNWMLITAIGSYFGKYVKIKFQYIQLFIIFILIICVLPVITVFLISYLKNFVFTIGAMLSILDVLIYSFLLLLPFCLSSGMIFTILAGFYSDAEKKNLSTSIYSFESIGSLTGGLLTGFVLIYLFSGIKSLLLISIVSLLVVLYIAFKERKKKIRFVTILIIILFSALFFSKIDRFLRQFTYINQEIEHIKDTPYGNITITEHAEQKNVFINGNLLFDTENTINNEESVHYAMVQIERPDNILLISGGLSGQLKEILKYKVKRIDYVEINRWLYDLLKDSIRELKDDRVKVFINDPLVYLKEASLKYNAIIINISEPNTLELNRYFTMEFFELVKTRVVKNGVLSFKLLSSMNYMSDEELEMSSSIYNTLSSVFENVTLIPGENNYYIASDNDISINIAGIIKDKGIDNEYVNQYYINDYLLKMRSESIEDSFLKNTDLNVDFKPVLYYNQIKHWMNFFPGRFWISGILILVVFIFFIIKSNHLTLAMFTAGFSGAALEIILIFGLQVLFGNIYQYTALIFAVFMAGLAVGANCSDRFFKKYNLSVRRIHFMIALKAIISAILLIVLHHIGLGQLVVYIIFIMMIALIGFAVGAEFLSVSKIQQGTYIEVSGNTYSYDLLGASFGALLTSLYLIPVLGIVNAAIIIGIVNIFMILFLTLKGKE